jgi:AcrR family transcriptional regulator
VDDRRGRKEDAIVVAVLNLLESEGYDAVQLRVVAQGAGVSLRTIYKYFPTRDELILTAVERWMQDNAYSGLATPPQGSLYEVLMWYFRQIFEPWERSPRMLEAFHRARIGPGGERLRVQGLGTAVPVALELLDQYDPLYAEDVGLLLTLVVHAAIANVVHGDLEITDLLRVIERAVFRLTSDNADAAAVPRRKPQREARRRRYLSTAL